MSIRLTLADANSQYIEKLAAWIHKHMPYQFSIEVLTCSESFQSWAESGGQADLIVISIDLAKQVLPFLSGKGVLILDDGTHEPLDLDAPRVEKYRPAEELAKDILSLCADRIPGMHARERHRQNITLVIYLDGADAFHPVAPALACLFSARNRKTLYFSLEQAQTTPLFFSCTGPRGLNEMLYYVKSNRDNLFMRLETCLIRDPASGVHLLAAPAGLLSPKDIELSDIAALLSATDKEGDFDEIVLATDMGMFELIPGLMEKASLILAVAFNTAVSALKLERFLHQLEKEEIDMAGLKEKLRLLLVNICRYDSFDEKFADIRKHRLDPHPFHADAAGWTPSDKDLSALAGMLDDEAKAGYGYE